MYWANQIIWDLDNKKPVQLSNPDSAFAWDGSQYPKNHTHLVWKKTGKTYVNEGGLTGAQYLLENGEIGSSK